MNKQEFNNRWEEAWNICQLLQAIIHVGFSPTSQYRLQEQKSNMYLPKKPVTYFFYFQENMELRFDYEQARKENPRLKVTKRTFHRKSSPSPGPMPASL